MGKVVSFINMKGGVGKTTMAVNIGYTLAKNFGKKVLLIDVDPQMNATQYTLYSNGKLIQDILDDPKKTIYGLLRDDGFELPLITSKPKAPRDAVKFDGIFKVADNFYIIPSHLKTMTLSSDMTEHPLKLDNYIKENLKKQYDIIILDSPPTISAYTRISLMASDGYIVPMKPDYLSLFGLPLLESYINQIKKEYSLNLEFLGIILTMITQKLIIYNDIKRILSERPEWESKLFRNELKHSTIVARSLSPEEMNTHLPYIIEMGDNELKMQMISITQEFMRRLRL